MITKPNSEQQHTEIDNYFEPGNENAKLAHTKQALWLANMRLIDIMHVSVVLHSQTK